MSKHRSVKRKKKVHKRTARKPARAPEVKAPPVKIKEVVLPPDTIVRVVHPSDVTPLAILDPERKAVHIVPVPQPTKRSDYEKSWWNILFGR